jgi:hypothetical protein
MLPHLEPLLTLIVTLSFRVLSTYSQHVAVMLQDADLVRLLLNSKCASSQRLALLVALPMPTPTPKPCQHSAPASSRCEQLAPLQDVGVCSARPIGALEP